MDQTVTPTRVGPTIGTVLIALTVVLACFFHIFRVDVLPMGFYVDESSIGYNAYLLGQTGADEHGEHLPLFFKAFGEYKNPLYIYLLAGFYRVFGYSEWTTRALSASCWLLGSVFLYALGRRLFARTTIRLYIALTLGFTPWIFALSRVSFELIVLYPLLALHLLALYRGFEEGLSRWALVSGISLGLCLYAYTTFRLLPPCYGIVVLACFGRSHLKRQFLLFSLGAAACAVPFLVYAATQYHNLTGRFDSLTYIHDTTVTFAGKVWIFLTRYLGYFNAEFLLLSGDENRRHHTGFGGELLPSTVALLMIALINFRRFRTSRFRSYLIVGLVLSPVAAALTLDTCHSLRAFSMVVFVVLLSAFGLNTLSESFARVVTGLTALCAALYVLHYFVIYPADSAVAFENFGFKEALHEALRRSPTRVLLSTDGNEPYINLRFFGSLAGTRIPLLTGTRADLRPGDVYISYDPTRGESGMYDVENVTIRGGSRN